MRPHEKLVVWGKSIELVVKIYKFTEKFPDSEKFGLAQQMKRASVSIPSNIAEGAARKGRKEFIYFLYSSLGSLSELETQILIGYKLGYIDNDSYNELKKDTEVIGMLLFGLIKERKIVKSE